MLVHEKRPDTRTWLPLFSLCYFHHDKDSDASRSKHQAHTMDGIVVGCSSSSNAILVYNPRNQRYYEPDSYKLDPNYLPSSVYTNIVYDGGLFVSLHQDDTPQISEPYPPGTRVIETNPDNGVMRSGTVMDIPLDPSSSPHYLVLFDDGTSTLVTASNMPSLIHKPTVNVSDTSHLLPPFVCKNSKILFNQMGDSIKVISLSRMTGPTALATSLIQTRNMQNGVCPCPILLLLGMTCASTELFLLQLIVAN